MPSTFDNTTEVLTATKITKRPPNDYFWSELRLLGGYIHSIDLIVTFSKTTDKYLYVLCFTVHNES